MNISMEKTEDLIPFDKNPRVNSMAVTDVAMSIREHGFNQPIVVDQNNIICVGHTRWLAALEESIEEVPVYKKEMTREEFIAYNVADNKTSEKSFWETDLLSDLMKELSEAERETTGFSSDEIDELMDTSDLDDLLEGEDPPDNPSENGLKKNHVKMVQLFYDDVTFPKFIEMCETIQAYMTTDNLTDTVYNSVEKVYDEVKHK